MKTIYINPTTFQCYTSQNTEGTYIKHETNFFDGKCDAYIEGYRFIPSGKSWIRSDGKVFYGEMIAAWKPYSELETAQHKYEKQKINEYERSLLELGVEL